MSPDKQIVAKKQTAESNLYTVYLAVVFCLVLATTVLVAYKCYYQYGTIFKIP